MTRSPLVGEVVTWLVSEANKWKGCPRVQGAFWKEDCHLLAILCYNPFMDKASAIEAGTAAPPMNDPILRSYRAALQEAYGERLDRVVLFGSRARGDASDQSDYDVAVFLKTMPDRWAAFDDLADLRTRFLMDTGAFFDAFPYPTTAYSERTPLMQEIRRDGLTL